MKKWLHNLLNQSDNSGGNQPLAAHQYPLWIIFFAIGLVAATLYSFSLLPKYFDASKKMHAAEAAFQNKNYNESIQLYHSVFDIVPTSKVVRINAAEVIFSSSDRSYDQTGLALLQGVALSKEAWERIARVMPLEYQQYFKEVKQ